MIIYMRASGNIRTLYLESGEVLGSFESSYEMNEFITNYLISLED
jgi:hypothetical protein